MIAHRALSLGVRFPEIPADDFPGIVPDINPAIDNRVLGIHFIVGHWIILIKWDAFSDFLKGICTAEDCATKVLISTRPTWEVE